MTTPALQLLEHRLGNAGKRTKWVGDKLVAQCPVHNDKEPSFGAWTGTTRPVVMRCLAGCDNDAIMAALGLEWTDFPHDGEPPRQHDQRTAEYLYCDTKGKSVYKVVRRAGKKFHQERIDTSTGEWVKGLQGVARLPYHLDELIVAAQYDRPIWIAEGEKDVDRLRQEGVCATCNSGGASNWDDNLDQYFNNLSSVTIVADNDDPGTAHAESVKARLEARGCTVRIVRAAAGKDAFDHLEAGFTLDQFIEDGVEPGPAPWPAPIPIGGGYDALPLFPVEVFPDWIGDQVRQVSKELQVPIDAPAMLAIVALATAAAKRAEVWVTRSWREQLCLYVVVALPPGDGKSPTFGQMLGPLVELERELLEDALPRIEEQATRRLIKEKEQKKAIDKGETALALTLGDELRALKTEPEPRLFVDDVTVEKLGEMLRDQHGRLALVSTEGGLFDQMIGRYSEKVKASLDPYLQMWSGDTVRVDRIGRGSVIIDKPALNIGVTVQPSVIAALADRPELKGRGLTARFMYSLPKSNVGYRNMIVDADLDENVVARYSTRLKRLWRDLAAYEIPMRLEITPQAKAEFMEWRQMLEDERRPGGAMVGLIEWSRKVESSVARLAGLLHIAHDKGGSPIDLADMRAALTVGEYWITHAQAVHEIWGTDPVTHVAQQVIRWADENELTEFSLRDAYNANRSLMPRADDALEPLGLLVERGWIAPLFDGPLTVGKRGVPSPRFAVHPELSSHIRNNHAVMRFMRIETHKTSPSLPLSTDTDKRESTHDTHDTHDPHVEVEPAPTTVGGEINPALAAILANEDF